MTRPKPDLIILWSTSPRAVKWVATSWRTLGDTVAYADANDFWLRDYTAVGAPLDYGYISTHVLDAWRRIRAGEDLANWATHELDPHQQYHGYRPVVHEHHDDGEMDALDLLEDA